MWVSGLFGQPPDFLGNMGGFSGKKGALGPCFGKAPVEPVVQIENTEERPPGAKGRPCIISILRHD